MIKFVLISSSREVISFGFETEQHKCLCKFSNLGLSEFPLSYRHCNKTQKICWHSGRQWPVSCFKENSSCSLIMRNLLTAVIDTSLE